MIALKKSIPLLGAGLAMVLVLAFVLGEQVYTTAALRDFREDTEWLPFNDEVLRQLYSPVTHVVFKLYLCLWLGFACAVMLETVAHEEDPRAGEMAVLRWGMVFLFAAVTLSHFLSGSVLLSLTSRVSMEFPESTAATRWVDGVFLLLLLVTLTVGAERVWRLARRRQ